MKQVTKILAILMLTGLFFAPISPTLWRGSQGLLYAIATTSTDFNPNYLISDAEMQDATCMNQADVQLFLTQYNSALANLILPDLNGVNKNASEIIYNAAVAHKINPKYLLVKLQKEQSLITETSPSQKQLDGATGYGITDACGWDCEMYKNNQGFGKQVDSAAGIIRWYYDNKQANDWIKKAGISYLVDGQTIIPANDATAFLYTYTPHLHGNLNFWNLWQNWFGYSIPDGSLVKSADSPTIYLIQDGKKRAIKSMAVLASRFDTDGILIIPSAEIAIYPAGTSISFPNYSILHNGNNYYLVDFDTVRPFANFDVVKQLGYNPGEFIDVTDVDISGYTLGQTIRIDTSNPTGRLVKIKGTNSIYYLKDGFYHAVYNADMAKAVFSNLSATSVESSELQNYQPGTITKFPDGTLISEQSSNSIYVIEKGKKRLIATEEVFNGFGYNKKNIIKVDAVLSSVHENGPAVYLPSRLLSINNNDATTTETDSVNGVQSGEEIQENGKMYTISENKTTYVGKKINTNVNTYLIAEYESGKILAGKNIDTVRPMASFVKVMTAYELMYEGLNLAGQTTFKNSLKSKYHSFKTTEGEIFSNKDLLDALLVSSINTPARMLVSSIEKNENKFIAKINNRAKEWGLKNTKFVDVDGYDIKNITTARDYLSLYTRAERVREVREALSKKQYVYHEIKDLNKTAKHSDVHSNLLVNKPGLPFKIISSKTGYLNEAGAGLVMLVERPKDGKQFIIITMGNPDYTHRFVEPERLANWSLTNF